MSVSVNIEGLKGKVVTKTDCMYEEARTMWNRSIEKYPSAIVYCENIEDVKKCVRWAGTHKYSIRVRSGRHHYEGYSTGNDILVIDVSKINEICLHEEMKMVTIGGGVRNRELYEVLGKAGYPFPGGGCPTVGVVGFALGGGWGYSGRLLGLGCDAIKEIKLINYEGELITASKEENSDLFWALKGSGGGQFGVVVSISFSLPEKRDEAVLVRLEYKETSKADQIKMWILWQDLIEELPLEVNFKLSFYNSKEKGTGMLLLGIYYGTAEQVHEVLKPFIKLGRNLSMLVQPMSVLEVNRWIQDAHPDYEHYKSSGRFVDSKLSEEEIERLLENITVRAKGSIYAALSCYGMGGRIKEVPTEETAFFYRNSLYILGFQSVWEDNQFSEENREWFKGRFNKIYQCTRGSFVNFPAQELEDYQNDYYGENKVALVKIREKYDPYQFFAFEQSIE